MAIENERDEDSGDGEIPQPPAGFLTIVDLTGAPAAWRLRRVELTGIATVAPGDPEPEYVSINGRDQVAVTLQENNHLAVVDLRSGRILNHFSAGSVTVEGVDTSDDGTIDPSDTITAAREPDAVAWLDDRTLGTADEGDYLGGSRTWTVFDAATGRVVYSSGTELQQAAIRQGQYPDGRSDNKGVEPEGLAVATFGRDRYAFVGMERANLVAVYDVNDPRRPRFLQALPTGVGPEGLLPIPATGTLVVSAEEDVAQDSVRSSLSSYRLTRTPLSEAMAHNQGAPSSRAWSGTSRGAEHCTVFSPPGRNEVDLLARFELAYDGKLLGCSADGPASPDAPRNEAHVLAALRWFAKQRASGYDGWASTPHELRGWRDAAPQIMIGMEGAPGPSTRPSPARVAPPESEASTRTRRPRTPGRVSRPRRTSPTAVHHHLEFRRRPRRRHRRAARTGHPGRTHLGRLRPHGHLHQPDLHRRGPLITGLCVFR